MTLATIVPSGAVFATENEDNSGTQIVSNEMEVTGNDSNGELISQEIKEKQSETEANNGCNIYTVEVKGKSATVSFDTIKDCTVLVALYDEDGKRMLASGKKEVEKGAHEVDVTIDTTSMPKYFYLRAFLIDSKSLNPLATAYESPNYTKTMVDFLEKTVNDFDSSKVVNFDNDKANNFAVYDDDTKIIDSTRDKNVLTKTDTANQKYVFENVDSKVSSLKPGDIFAYEDGETLIVKVESISVSGTTATIQGQNTNLEEVFEYVKIDTSTNISEAEVDNSNLEDGIVYNGKTKDSLQAQGIGYDTTLEKSLSYSIKKGVLKGSFNLKIETVFKLYLERKYKYVELSFDTVTSVDLSVEKEIEKSIVVGEIKCRPIPVVEIALTPKVEFSFSGKIKFSGKLKKKYGALYDSNFGYKEIKDKVTVESNLDIKGKVFIGLSFKPAVNAIHEDLISIYCEIKGGGEIKAENHVLDYTFGGNSEKHDCKVCLDGEINFKSDITFGIELLKKHEIKAKAFEATVKIADFYYSIDHREFGFGTCPYIRYKVIANVRDQYGRKLQGATVNDIETNKSGEAVLWLRNGKYTLTAKKANYKTKQKKITVKDRPTETKIALEEVESVESNVGLIDGKKVKQVSVGGSYGSSCAAITEDGALYTWGNNVSGILGNGTTKTKKTPVKIMDNVSIVELHENWATAIKADGSLYMWGMSILAEGTIKDRNTPVKVLDNVISVQTLGFNKSAAIKSNGDLYIWGTQNNGEPVNQGVPMKVMSNVKAVKLSYTHDVAVTNKGELYVWDYETNPIEEGCQPIKVMDNAESIESVEPFDIVITKNNTLYIWDEFGEKKDIRSGEENAVKLMENVKSAIYGLNGLYVITNNGTLYCCDLAAGNKKAKKVMDNVIEGTFDSPCAVIKNDGSLYMWGEYDKIYSKTPKKMLQNVKSFSTVKGIWKWEGLSLTAAITKDGYLYIWGWNDHGQLGNGTTKSNWTPTKIGTKTKTKSATARTAEINGSQTMTALAQGTSVTTSIKKKIYSKLYANTMYNFYVMKERDAKDPLASDNLLYIGQKMTNNKGSATFTYGAKESCSSAELFVVATPANDLRYYKPTLKATKYTYTGKAIKPEPNLVIHGKVLEKGKDYTVRYSDNIKVGTSTVILKGKGTYDGLTSTTFNIVPKKAAIVSVSSPKQKVMQIKWKKNKEATGYQIYTSKSKNFKSLMKINVKGMSKLSYKVTKLTSKKKYFVKVRAYKTINGRTYYGSWSPVKSVVVK